MSKFEDIQEKLQTAQSSCAELRQERQNDLYFYWVSHWADEELETVPLRYRGQFDLLRKAGRKIISDLLANDIQATFVPDDLEKKELGEFMADLYRTDMRRNESREALEVAINEQVPAGMGAWRLCTEWETDRIGDTRKVIRRKPITEANSTLYIDPSAKRIDKSDAKWMLLLVPYTPEAYEELKNSYDCNDGSFSTPVYSVQNLWAPSKDLIYVGEYYERYQKKEKILYYQDMFGQPTAYYKSQLIETKLLGELEAAGYTKVDERDIKIWRVKKYICSADGILDSYEIAGEYIPIVPVYGERAFVNGEEYYEGIVKLAKDPQMINNFAMSYLADIVSSSPRSVPQYDPRQLEGHEWMYEEAGANDRLPFKYINLQDQDGNPLPPGPASVVPELPVPTALIQMLGLMREAVSDVAQSSAPNSVADVDLSGSAIGQIRAMMDEQSLIFREHMKYALRRDAEIYASMCKEVYDLPRKVILTKETGEQEEAEIMQSVIDLETGEHRILNDLRDSTFNVNMELGEAYESQKQALRQELTVLMQSVPPTEPEYKLLLYKYLSLSSGKEVDDVIQYANKQLIQSGLKEPKTEKEIEWAQQAAQPQPSADMELAKAEQMKAQAQLIGKEIDQFNAETDRMKVMIDAEKAGVEIDYKKTQIRGQEIDNFKSAMGY